MAQHIRELMTPNPVSLPGTASVHEAARAMRDADIGDVIVIEHQPGLRHCHGPRYRGADRGRGAGPGHHHLGRHLQSSLTHCDAHGQRRGGGAAHAHPCHSPLAGGRRGARRWALCRSGIWRWSGIRTRRWARLAPPHPTPNRGQARTTATPRVSPAHDGEGSDCSSPARLPPHTADSRRNAAMGFLPEVPYRRRSIAG